MSFIPPSVSIESKEKVTEFSIYNPVTGESKKEYIETLEPVNMQNFSKKVDQGVAETLVKYNQGLEKIKRFIKKVKLNIINIISKKR